MRKLRLPRRSRGLNRPLTGLPYGERINVIYKIAQRLIFHETFTVEADSVEEAIEKVDRGEIEADGEPVYHDVDETYQID